MGKRAVNGERWYRIGLAATRRGARVLLLASAAVMVFALAAPAWAQDAQNEGAQAEAKAAAAAAARARAKNLANLMEGVRQLRKKQAAVAARRESAARDKLEEQKQLVQKARAREAAAKAHAAALRKQFRGNKARIGELSKLLAQHQGDLGELFGVVRVVAAKASKEMRESLLSTQFEPKPGQDERALFLQRLAQSKSLPSIDELQRLWFELLRETVGEGGVVRYRTDVMQLDDGKPTGKAVPTDVVRVGPFTVVNGDEYLGYLSSIQSLSELNGVLPGSFRDTAEELTQAAPGSGYTSAVVDIARGGLLGRYLERPSWLERVQLGETVGYLIIAVGIIGVLLALFQYIYLLKTRLALRAQLGNLAEPRLDNPLGRLLLTIGGNSTPPRAEVAALRLHEAVQQEVPKLERFQGFLRLVIAAGPLLGLVGTVTGMIITFHAIVASGGGDPTVMATGIGHAMIATVLGLGVAIPLLFINMGLTAFSNSITQVLDEFSNKLLAAQMKAGAGRDVGALLGGEGDQYRPSR
ncbi:MAG TPA: MotA/TolQ/ExbB proton channel family protein [Gammaproteobacteria bacterium]|nr:MotA/TolQ/ExbB proton channel family protein [Gammaproteobacteria bacterium]